MADWPTTSTTCPASPQPSDRLQLHELRTSARSTSRLRQGVFDKPYPLTPDTAGTSTYGHSGTLRGGSGHHVDIVQAPLPGRGDHVAHGSRAGTRCSPGVGEASRSRSPGYGEAHDLFGRRRGALRRVRHRLPRERRRPLPHPGRHRGDPHPPGPPADRATSCAARAPILRSRASLAWCSRAGTTPPRLGLQAKETYTTYADVGRDTLLLVLQASPKDCLCRPHLEVSDRRADPIQGILRPARPPSARPPASPPGATTSTSGPQAPSPRSAGSTIRCSTPRSPAIRSSWPPRSSTRSRTIRST